MVEPKAVGIDLGTTNSAVACLDHGGKPQMLRNEEGDTVTPSAVFFRATGDILVGKAALSEGSLEPGRLARFFKREMGNFDYQPDFGDASGNAESLSAQLLFYLREQAERQLGELGPAVVTVPAYFHNTKREATIRAAEAAGLKIARTINEPTAAAVAYAAERPQLQGTLMVYDLGGGTFDVTILEFAPDRANVIGSDGDHDLGGVLWDNRLVNYVCDVFAAEAGLDPRDDPFAVHDLRLRCEDAKKALSSRIEVNVPVSTDGHRAMIPVSRNMFEDLTADLVDQTRILMIEALRAAGLTWPEIDAVLLVGGSTRMPAVTAMLQTLTRKDPLRDINPDECVAAGAAIEAARVGESKLTLGSATRTIRDVTPHSLGYVAISPDGSRFINDIIIPRNTPCPVALSHSAEVSTTAHQENSFDIYLLQGESQRVLDNTVLGRYEVAGVPHGEGKTRVSIAFSYDLSGVVSVTCALTDGSDLATAVVQDDVDLKWTDLDPEEWVRRNAAAICLLFDTSGSMSGEGIRQAKQAAKHFLEESGNGAKIALVEFGRSPGRTLCALTGDHDQLRSAINSLEAGNGTPLTEGLRTSQSLLADIQTQQILLVLTDGMPDDPEGALLVAGEMKRDGVRIIAVGAGSSIDEDFLRRLASSSQDGMNVDFSELTSTFGSIAQAMGSGAGISAGDGLAVLKQ